MTTIGRDSDWAGVLRGERTKRLVVCPSCGCIRMDLGGPHAPRFVGDTFVDCVGTAVVMPRGAR